MSRKFKAVFTMEETIQLTRLFDAGLDSVSKEKAELSHQRCSQEVKQD